MNDGKDSPDFRTQDSGGEDLVTEVFVDMHEMPQSCSRREAIHRAMDRSGVYDLSTPFGPGSLPRKNVCLTEKQMRDLAQTAAPIKRPRRGLLEGSTLRESDPFESLLLQMLTTYRAKNADYSGSDKADPLRNFKAARDLGVEPHKGILVRMSDKWMRIQNLTRTGSRQVADEAVTDTLLDLANYALLCIMTLNDEKGK